MTPHVDDGTVVVPLRWLMRVWSWDDRLVTTCAVYHLALLAVLLALVPWALVLPVAFRALGLAAFGPHMYWVGKRLERQVRKEALWEQEYRRADKAGKKVILQRHRRRLTEEYQARLDREWVERSVGRDRALHHFLKEHKHVGVVEERRDSARFKYRPLPDPHRSRAYPLTQGREQPPTEEAVKPKGQ